MASQLNLARGTYRSTDVFRALVDAGWSQRRISGSHHIFSRAAPSPTPAPSPAPSLGELENLASTDDRLSSSTRGRGGKKSKKKGGRISAVRLEGEDEETAVDAEQSEQLEPPAQMASMVPANSDVSRSTIDEQD